MSIEIKNLTKIFGKKIKALNSVSIIFKKNTITGLIGFNGSGKTTIFNIIAGFMKQTNGTLFIDGHKPTLKDRRKLSYLAVSSEHKNSIKAITQLNQIAQLYDADKNWTEKKISYLSKVLDFTQFLSHPIKSLSKGNQQKIKIISSFLNPKVKYMLLDEPFDGLDPIMTAKVVQLYLSLKNVTIIITSHRMEVVQQITTEFYVLKNGILVDSRQTDDPTIFVTVNKEVSLTAIRKLDYIMQIIEKDTEWEITVKNIDYYKELNIKLLNLKKFKWCSLKAKSIAESVFSKYVNEGEKNA